MAPCHNAGLHYHPYRGPALTCAVCTRDFTDGATRCQDNRPLCADCYTYRCHECGADRRTPGEAHSATCPARPTPPHHPLAFCPICGNEEDGDLGPTDHIKTVMEGVSSAQPKAHFWCQRCGTREVIPMPLPVRDFVRASERFIHAHVSCKPALALSHANTGKVYLLAASMCYTRGDELRGAHGKALDGLGRLLQQIADADAAEVVVRFVKVPAE